MCEKNRSSGQKINDEKGVNEQNVNEDEVVDEYATNLIKETDPEGSSTGVPEDITEEPMQDACDL